MSCLRVANGCDFSAIVRNSVSRAIDRIGSICRNAPPVTGLKAVLKTDGGTGRDRRGEAIEQVHPAWEMRYLSTTDWPFSRPFRYLTRVEERVGTLPHVLRADRSRTHVVSADGHRSEQSYPNLVSTFRVICSICGSLPASPWAQSVDPDVTTVAPDLFVYAPRTAWP